MRVIESQLHRIARGTLVREARSLDPEISGYIDRLVRSYSQITDDDVAALEGIGFFGLISGGKRWMDDDFHGAAPDYVIDAYYAIRAVAPLRVAFTASEMTDVETLRAQLEAWARKNPGDAVEWLPDISMDLKGVVSNARRDFKKFLAKSEGEPGDPLGRIAFAAARKGMPYEPDTKVEEKLRYALIDHFAGSSLLTPEMARTIRDFMAQGLYPSMFSEPTAEVVYRGMNVEGRGVGWLKKLAGGKLEGEQGSISVNTKYVPRKGAASWTTSKRVASDFFHTGADYHIILHARVADNPGMFVSAERGLYKTDFAARFADEREALGLGTIRVYKIDWFLSDSHTWGSL